jgi:aryl-phospho-beta-D-glucosidase BglC (GH1 family)
MATTSQPARSISWWWGAHWVPAKAGLQWPLQWEPKDIEADFAKMAEMGFNTVRLDLFWGMV